MKLSTLYTEDLTLEASNPFKSLMSYASKAMGRTKQTPNPKIARIKRMINEVYQEIWGDFYQNDIALKRIDAYRHSIEQHIPAFLKIEDEEELRNTIETLFRKRATMRTSRRT